MRDDLVGFLMGALDASEHEQIKRKLETDAQLREDLQKVERCLTPLSWDNSQEASADYAPPVGLAERTCSLVADYVETGGVSTTAAQHAFPATGEASIEPASQTAPRRMKSAEQLAGESSEWTFADFVVAAGICFAAACLFFPALVNSRYNAQLAQCQNNMRGVGQSLVQYSENNGGYFPVIPDRGKLAVAGAYVPMLREKGLVEKDQMSMFSCPSRQRQTVIVSIPRPQDVNNAQGRQLVAFQRSMGGDYAYHLGYVKNGKLHGIKNQNRSHYAILADSPNGIQGKHIGTHGKGQNVLFEHGNVAFQTTRTRFESRNDDIFVNDRGEVQAGIHEEDVVLAPSSTPPIVFVSN